MRNWYLALCLQHAVVLASSWNGGSLDGEEQKAEPEPGGGCGHSLWGRHQRGIITLCDVTEGRLSVSILTFLGSSDRAEVKSRGMLDLLFLMWFLQDSTKPLDGDNGSHGISSWCRFLGRNSDWHNGGDIQTTGGYSATSKRMREIKPAGWTGRLRSSGRGSVFMAREGRSHVCISCCTNIVQCRAWKDDGGGRSSGGGVGWGRGGWPPSPAKKKHQQEKEKLPFVFWDCKRDLSQWGDWEERSPNLSPPLPSPHTPISNIPPRFPAVTFGNDGAVKAA